MLPCSHAHSSLTATQTRGFHAIIGANSTKEHLNPAEDLCGGAADSVRSSRHLGLKEPPRPRPRHPTPPPPPPARTPPSCTPLALGPKASRQQGESSQATAPQRNLHSLQKYIPFSEQVQYAGISACAPRNNIAAFLIKTIHRICP